MTEDAIYLSELISMQQECLFTQMKNFKGKERINKFDQMSYSAFAISEFFQALSSTEIEYEYPIVSSKTMTEVLRLMIDEYDSYYNEDKQKHIKFKYMRDTLSEMYKIVRGYYYD